MLLFLKTTNFLSPKIIKKSCAQFVCVVFFQKGNRKRVAPTWVIRCKKGQKIFCPYQTLSVLVCAFGAGDVINMYFWAYYIHPLHFACILPVRSTD
jgi:hypothetical protein